MVQILLIGLGLFILVKGNLKVSDAKEIVRPQSIYWGLIVIAYGIVSSFLPEKLIYFLVFYGSVVLISVIFVVTGKTISTGDAAIKSANTKRNLIILLVFIALVSLVAASWFVWQWRLTYETKAPAQKETRAPEITILYPNGGEKLQTGQYHYIKWTATGGRDNVFIVLRNKNGQLIYYAAGQRSYPAFVPNTGSYLLYIPSTEQAGDYKAEVMLCPSDSSDIQCGLAEDVYDESDDYFSIVAATTTLGNEEIEGENTGNVLQEYKSVKLNEVINYRSLTENIFVRTTGLVVGLDYGRYGGDILLTDNSGNYLLIVICHACISDYLDILPVIKKGDIIEVAGRAMFTVPKDSDLKTRYNIIQELPETIGMLSLEGYVKINGKLFKTRPGG